MIGWGCCHLQNSSITTRFILPLNTLLSSLTPGVFLRWALNWTNLSPMWNPSTSSETGWRTPWRKWRQLWPSQKTTWRSTTIGNGPQLQSSKQGIWSSSMLVTSRPLDTWRSFLTKDWDRSQLIVKLVMVCTSSAFLCWWVDFIPSSMWSSCLWLLQTPSLADGWLRPHFQKLSTAKKSGWWRKSSVIYTPPCVLVESELFPLRLARNPCRLTQTNSDSAQTNSDSTQTNSDSAQTNSDSKSIHMDFKSLVRLYHLFTSQLVKVDKIFTWPGSDTAGTGWCFPQKNPFQDMFCDFQRVFPMETQKVPLFQKSISVGKTLWKSQNMSQNGFFWGNTTQHPLLVPGGVSPGKTH